MARLLRVSAFRLAIAYIALSIGVLAIVAVPLWYGWRQNIQHVRDEIIKEDAQSLSDILTSRASSRSSRSLVPGWTLPILSNVLPEKK